jgi:hypothetical protein
MRASRSLSLFLFAYFYILFLPAFFWIYSPLEKRERGFIYVRRRHPFLLLFFLTSWRIMIWGASHHSSSVSGNAAI